MRAAIRSKNRFVSAILQRAVAAIASVTGAPLAECTFVGYLPRNVGSMLGLPGPKHARVAYAMCFAWPPVAACRSLARPEYGYSFVGLGFGGNVLRCVVVRSTCLHGRCAFRDS